ncbi:hypothetical protein [Microvirga yunnanensis]|nr:hypothetical protein [Microvirga sp. HBU65207]
MDIMGAGTTDRDEGADRILCRPDHTSIIARKVADLTLLQVNAPVRGRA